MTDLATIAKKKFTPEETKLLDELTKPGAKIEVTVPGEIDPKEWNKTTSVVCRALLRAQIQEQKLLPVMGRLLLIAKQNTEIWKGHKSFKEFLHTEIRDKYGLPTSSAYEGIAMAERYGHLEIGLIETVPRRNMRIVLQAVAKGDEKKPYAKALLVKAADLSESDLRDYCEEKELLESGEPDGQFIRFGTNKARGKKIKAWFEDPRVQAKCQTAKWDEILEFMIADCAGEWLATAAIEANKELA